MKYIIGLGNPGNEYIQTRHNVGFMILDYIYNQYTFSDWKHDKYIHADSAIGTINQVEYTLVKPMTFMNNSGQAVAGLIKKDVSSEDIIVIYDDLAYSFGTIRIAQEKSDGGHNGIASIIQVLPQFVRIRIGIHSFIPGTSELVELKNEINTARAEFVLKDFRPDELDQFPTIANHVVEILKSIETVGLERTMTEINKRK